MKQSLLLSALCFLSFSAKVNAQNDCIDNLFICTTTTGTAAGIGIQELNATNQGCLATGEHSTVWYTINITSSGNLTMLIAPTGFFDFDFAVWGPMGANSCPVTTLPRRCSYAIGGGDNTGINSALNAPATDTSEGSSGNQWVQDLMVQAGESYTILVDQWSGGSGSFQISFGGTAILNCIPTSVEENENSGKTVSIYPNPFSETAVLRITNVNPSTNYELSIYDLVGKEIKADVIRNSEGFVIRRGALPSGMYFYHVSDKEKIIDTGKIIIE